MRIYLAAVALTVLVVPSLASAMKPPREESPASQAILADVGIGNSDAELEQAVAAAAAHPLGTLANPVRAGGPEGARSYLARLRCADGTSARIGTRSTGETGTFGSIVERYPLECAAAAPGKAEILIDIYHMEHIEDRAPPGFSIAPR